MAIAGRAGLSGQTGGICEWAWKTSEAPIGCRRRSRARHPRDQGTRKNLAGGSAPPTGGKSQHATSGAKAPKILIARNHDNPLLRNSPFCEGQTSEFGAGSGRRGGKSQLVTRKGHMKE